MNRIKMAVFDIDWTLFDHHLGAFTPSAIHAITRAKEHGVKIVIASGRAYHLIQRIGALEAIPYDAIIASNGACIYIGKECIEETPLPASAMHTLMKRMNDHHLLVELITSTSSFINLPRNEAMDKIYFHYPADTPIILPFDQQKILTGILFMNKDYDSLIEDLPLDFYRFHEDGVDVFNRDNHKGNALKKVLAYYGFSPKDCIAFGDDINDIDMLKVAGVGVAVGNANPALKAIADYVTDSIDQDGIQKALKRFAVID